jgi:hypothetical protein
MTQSKVDWITPVIFGAILGAILASAGWIWIIRLDADRRIDCCSVLPPP